MLRAAERSLTSGGEAPKLRRPMKKDNDMITNFLAPWRIVELLNGFAVEDATGRQIGVFYGRAPDGAGTPAS
jgi:hypothetical protein